MKIEWPTPRVANYPPINPDRTKRKTKVVLRELHRLLWAILVTVPFVLLAYLIGERP